MNTYDIRDLPTTDYLDKQSSAKWTLSRIRQSSNGYKLYYWLMANSCWNCGERHYYIYDKEWKKIDVATSLGCTVKTITNNLKLLEQNNLIARAPNQEAYLIYYPLDAYCKLDKNIIKLFMSFGDKIDWGLMIRLYSLLLYGTHKSVNKFTASVLLNALGIDGSPANRLFVHSCIGFWESIGLMRATRMYDKNKFGEEYVYYLVDRIDNSNDNIIKYLNDDGDDKIKLMWSNIDLIENFKS